MAEGLLASVLQWLRAGYPEGIPPKDYFPLLALLRTNLPQEHFSEVTALLEGEDKVKVSHIREALERVTREEPGEAEIREVAAHLAAGGWPLSSRAMRLAQEEPAPSVAEAGAGLATAEAEPEPEIADGPVEVAPEPRSLVERILAWLRAGYPEGVPTTDYVPILALLRRRIADDEVAQVADALAHLADGDGEVSRIDAQVLMSKVLDGLPTEADLDRVAERLESTGVTLV